MADTKKVPTRRQCGTMQVHYGLLEANPGFRAKQALLEVATQRVRAMAAFKLTKRTIPVVVHVVYNTAAENISDAQIKSQIAVLNKDYRATNADKSKVPPAWKGLVADGFVEFVLASKDPKGAAAKGITRTHTSRTSFTANDDMKFAARGGRNAWSTKKYLNLWVCSLAGGLLGYAQFPGGPQNTDGVVILNTGFGTTGSARAPFNLGRTATHEIGHWLNLRHIWGDDNGACTGTDFVADTPNAAGPNFGKPAFPHVTCNNGPNGDMFMNYMDYVDDNAMFMFTAQQVTRMATTLAGPRSTIGV